MNSSDAGADARRLRNEAGPLVDDFEARSQVSMIQSVAGLLRARLSNDKLSLALSNKIDALSHAQAAVREFLEKLGVSERRIFETELVFEELFTNTVRHGYADRALHWIEVTLHLTETRSS
jgi:two-component sensor histidine kinase